MIQGVYNYNKHIITSEIFTFLSLVIIKYYVFDSEERLVSTFSSLYSTPTNNSGIRNN
jgi:hypothetical protein